MVRITSIEVLLVSEDGKATTNQSYYRWVDQRIRIERSRIPRFKHWLRWYLKHCHDKEVVVMVNYSELPKKSKK